MIKIMDSKQKRQLAIWTWHRITTRLIYRNDVSFDEFAAIVVLRNRCLMASTLDKQSQSH